MVIGLLFWGDLAAVPYAQQRSFLEKGFPLYQLANRCRLDDGRVTRALRQLHDALRGHRIVNVLVTALIAPIV